MTKATRRRADAESGLALIDLMTAVMALTVLFAIALPAFLGFQRTARDRAAQGEIERVLAAQQSIWQQRGEYTGSAGDLAALEPDLVIDASDPAAGVTVTLNRSAGTLCIERASASGATFAVWEILGQGTLYGKGGGLTGACPGSPPAGYRPGGW